MFQTFTGTSRRPRQVDLSRRNPNPFAKHGSPQGSSDTVANIQHVRAERQQERLRISAATKIQKTLRGHQARRRFRVAQREEWDKKNISHEAQDHGSCYHSSTQAHYQLVHLLHFADFQDDGDQQRLEVVCRRLLQGVSANRDAYLGGPWPLTYLRLQNTCLDALQRSRKSGKAHDSGLRMGSADLFQNVIVFTSQAIPEVTSKNALFYYSALRRTLLNATPVSSDILVAPLRHLGPHSELAYDRLAIEIMTIPHLAERVKAAQTNDASLDALAEDLNCKLLTASLSRLLDSEAKISEVLEPHKPGYLNEEDARITLTESCSWLAAHVIYLQRHAYGFDYADRFVSDATFTSVICALLSVVADDVTRDRNPDATVRRGSLMSQSGFSQFVRSQFDILIDQKAIESLLMQMRNDPPDSLNTELTTSRTNGHTRTLATYILTLLRLYPDRADDIRMWLYVGSSSALVSTNKATGPAAVRFFWRAARDTTVFRSICEDPRNTIHLLKSPKPTKVFAPNSGNSKVIADEWQILLLFIEMYSFVLKVMDDEEFLSYDDTSQSTTSPHGRKNSLRLDEIMTLSIFLKHIGFTMYYNAADILGTRDEESNRDISSLFKSTGQSPRSPETAHPRQANTIIGGMNLDYLKGAVTGLLRAIYDRDSRRPFAPKRHWLMTRYFNMTSFVESVVEEEQRRHQVQDAEAEEDDESDDEPQMGFLKPSGLVGTSRAQQIRRLEEQAKRQRKESRKRYLQAVAPRLEILQNMPFFIPFTTRVQIFKRFVDFDKAKRREGVADPEMWRMMHLNSAHTNVLERHHAQVQRGKEFSDAFDQFYGLGVGLKEPIHISFLDQFGQEEAGIDGGGVTKEFLTSVTTEAFSETQGVKLFVENDQHFLYPNPNALDELSEQLKSQGFRSDSAEHHAQMTNMLQRYEFLGRIIGKCLYESILIDVGFAGFFLLKWALTGGTGSAPKESGYRANINDLRDYDEELYQGLLKLKNYPGNVEDFALNFTVADTLSIPMSKGGRRSKVINRELRPNGTDIAVTNSNRLVYISYMARHRLTTQPARQTNAFLKGLGSMISPSWLSMFNQQELQTLVGGAASAIDVEDLRANTSYGGLYVIGNDGLEHSTIQIFWQVMRSLSDEDRRQVLKFVTSTPRAPLLGFGSLNPKFSIRDSGNDNSRLPSTSTCVNLLKLPLYSSFETCRTKLLQAVNSGAGFDLS